MLPYRYFYNLLSRAFGICLIPDYYPCPDPRPVSCYALFEWMAASKPTSWLSRGPDFVRLTQAEFRDLRRRSGFFSSRGRTLAPAPLLRDCGAWAFGVRQVLTGGEALSTYRSLYLSRGSSHAAPKCLSGSTSYLQVWLAFHSYTHLIQKLFNAYWCGPPSRVTETSTWTCVDHLVSRLPPPTKTPYSGSLSLRLTDINTLNLAGDGNS